MHISKYIKRSTGRKNTYIKGGASTVGTAAILAGQLSIAEADIHSFEISGADVYCNIYTDYSIILSGFDKKTNGFDFEEFWDYDGHCTETGWQSFYQMDSLLVFHAPNLTTVGDGAFDCNFPEYTDNNLLTLYIPKCTALGTTAADNNVARANNTNCDITVDDSLQTNNGGSPDGDLTGFKSVTYITN